MMKIMMIMIIINLSNSIRHSLLNPKIFIVNSAWSYHQDHYWVHLFANQKFSFPNWIDDSDCCYFFCTNFTFKLFITKYVILFRFNFNVYTYIYGSVLPIKSYQTNLCTLYKSYKKFPHGFLLLLLTMFAFAYYCRYRCRCRFFLNDSCK